MRYFQCHHLTGIIPYLLFTTQKTHHLTLCIKTPLIAPINFEWNGTRFFFITLHQFLKLGDLSEILRRKCFPFFLPLLEEALGALAISQNFYFKIEFQLKSFSLKDISPVCRDGIMHICPWGYYGGNNIFYYHPGYLHRVGIISNSVPFISKSLPMIFPHSDNFWYRNTF